MIMSEERNENVLTTNISVVICDGGIISFCGGGGGDILSFFCGYG